MQGKMIQEVSYKRMPEMGIRYLIVAFRRAVRWHLGIPQALEAV
jgi:hypothetical protein